MASTAFANMFQESMSSTVFDRFGGASAWDLFCDWEDARYAEMTLGKTCFDCSNCTWDDGCPKCYLSGEEVDGETPISEHGCERFAV